MKKLPFVEGKTVWLKGGAPDDERYKTDRIATINYNHHEYCDVWFTRDSRIELVEQFAKDNGIENVVWMAPKKNQTEYQNFYVWRPPAWMLSGIAAIDFLLTAGAEHIKVTGFDLYGLGPNDKAAVALNAEAHDICMCAGYLKGAMEGGKVTGSELLHSALSRFEKL